MRFENFSDFISAVFYLNQSFEITGDSRIGDLFMLAAACILCYNTKGCFSREVMG